MQRPKNKLLYISLGDGEDAYAVGGLVQFIARCILGSTGSGSHALVTVLGHLYNPRQHDTMTQTIERILTLVGFLGGTRYQLVGLVSNVVCGVPK